MHFLGFTMVNPLLASLLKNDWQATGMYIHTPKKKPQNNVTFL